MEARKLIEGASYGPDALRVLFQAFDEAWASIAPRYGDDRRAVEAARLRLANVLLALMREDNRDTAELRDAALRHYDLIAGGP
jgi:hypothetical protein